MRNLTKNVLLLTGLGLPTSVLAQEGTTVDVEPVPAVAVAPDYCADAVPVQMCDDDNSDGICQADENELIIPWVSVWHTRFPGQAYVPYLFESPEVEAQHRAVGQAFVKPTGPAYACTWWKASEAGNAELLAAIEDSDVEKFHYPAGPGAAHVDPVLLSRDPANLDAWKGDGKYLDNIATVWMPLGELEVIPVPALRKWEDPNQTRNTRQTRDASGLGYLAVGPQWIGERNTEDDGANMSGLGVWVAGRGDLSLKNGGAVRLVSDRTFLQNFVYASNDENRVLVLDVDAGVAYVHSLGGKAQLVAGLNVDARTADVTYAGVDARTGRWAVGPELAVEGQAGNWEFSAAGTYGLGRVNTSVDIDGFEGTHDPLQLAKLDTQAMYHVGDRVAVGAGLEAERESATATTQDGGAIPQFNTLVTPGAYLDVAATEHLHVGAGLEGVLYRGDLGSKTNSTVGRVGLVYEF